MKAEIVSIWMENMINNVQFGIKEKNQEPEINNIIKLKTTNMIHIVNK